VLQANASTRHIELTLAAKKGAAADEAAAGGAAATAAAAVADGKGKGGEKGARGLPGGLVAGAVVEGGVVKAVEEKDRGKSVVVLELKGESFVLSVARDGKRACLILQNIEGMLSV